MKQAVVANMAQTGSAQREPSMEEILASIRRIIEDSDTARGPLDEGETPELSVTPAAVPDVQHEVEAFRAELDGFPAAEPVDAGEREAAASAVYISPRETVPGVEQQETPQAYERAAAYDERAAEPVAQLRPAAAAAAAETLAVESRQSLISDHAGRQVAAAFGELSEAFAAGRRRSFDEMAEEMLRPMLQDWLDNNLPTLVERLVREEIERVARGG